MSKLLSFFLPKVVVETFKAFGFFLALCLVLKVSPVSKSIFEMVSVLSFFAFPILAYFSKKVYLPASMDWVLLTPVKKRDIIFGNAIINIIKTLLIGFLLLAMYQLLFGFDLSLDEVIKIFTHAPKKFKGEVELPTSAWVFTTFLIILVSAFLAGILPNYAQNLQQRQNHHVPTSLKEKLNNPQRIIGVALFILAIIFMMADGNIISIPAFIAYGGFIGLFTLGVTASTLHSVKMYYPKKPLFIGFSVASLMLIAFLHSSYVKDIGNSRLSFEHRLDGLENLGSFHNNAGDKVFADLMEAPKKSRNLARGDFSSFLERRELSHHFSKLGDSWMSLCDTRKDHSCRLATYIHAANNEAFPDLLRKGCENDLRSCYELLKFQQLQDPEKSMLEARLREQCMTKDYAKASFCNGFRGAAPRLIKGKPAVQPPAP